MAVSLKKNRIYSLILILLTAIFMFCFTSCAKESDPSESSKTNTKGMPEQIPEDFSFYMEWGVTLDYAYDSKTGDLTVKGIDINDEGTVRNYRLTDSQISVIYNLICEMNPESYPDEFNPYKDTTQPPNNIIFTVTCNGSTKTVSCLNIAQGGEANGSKGKKFIAVYDKIVSILESNDDFPEVYYNYE